MASGSDLFNEAAADRPLQPGDYGWEIQRTPEQEELRRQAAAALAFAQQYYGDVVAGGGAAGQQQQLGLADAQRAAAAGIGARGNDALSRRAAVYGGGAMASRGVHEDAAMAAQEQARAAGLVHDAYGQNLEAYGAVMGDASQRLGISTADQAADAARRANQAAADRAAFDRMLGAGAGATGAAIAAAGKGSGGAPPRSGDIDQDYVGGDRPPGGGGFSYYEPQNDENYIDQNYSDMRLKQAGPPAGGDEVQRLYASDAEARIRELEAMLAARGRVDQLYM